MSVMNQIKSANMKTSLNFDINKHIRHFSPQNRCKVGTLMQPELSQKDKNYIILSKFIFLYFTNGNKLW